MPIFRCVSQSFQEKIDSLTTQLAQEKRAKKQVDLLNEIAYAYRRTSPDSVLLFAEEAYRIGAKIKYKKGTAVAFKNKGIAHYKLGSPSDTAIHFYEQSIQFAKEIGEYYTWVASRNNIALIHIYDLNYNLAIECFLEALDIYERHLVDPTQLLALIYGNLGFSYHKLDQNKKALMYYERCFELADELDLPLIYSIYLDEQVRTKMALNLYEEAIEDIKRVLPIQDELGDWESKTEALLNYAEIELTHKKYTSAFSHAQEAYQISKKNGFPINNARSLLKMTESLVGQGKIEEGLRLAKKARSIGESSEALIIEAEAFKILHKLYSDQKHYDSAYMYSLKYLAAEKQIIEARNAEITADIEAKSNIRQREREIEMLQHQKANQHLMMLLAIGTSILFLALLIQAIRLYVSKTRTATILNEKNIALESANLELREAEEALNQKNEELNKYIDSNMQLENFAYLASHDLREPITNVLGFSDYLIKNYSGHMDEMGKRCLSFIKDSSKRMEYLTTDLLTYAIIGKDKNFEKISCECILKEVLQDLSTSIVENQAVVSHSQLPEIVGIPTEVRMLFQNLISNAIKYKKPDVQPKIHISGFPSGRYVQFSIEDNGIGISGDFHEKVFMMFKRDDTENKYKGNSTGIGLAICKRVVESHNGKIWLESQVGIGTTFFFTLPKIDQVESVKSAKMAIKSID
ncbi:MAG: ATP-binding protein [Bacteroidota bacterium]